MSHGYQAVMWNRQKKRYDLTILVGVLLYIPTFMTLFTTTNPNATAETAMIRAFGTASFLLLHIILCIGPLARIDKRFLPLLYNRRHLGVTMFVLGLGHGVLSTLQFHGFGDLNPIVSIFVSNGSYDSVSQFPFHSLGFVALIILFLMAATSHDFWLANLSAPVWKKLHMGVYVAYALLVGHVVLGVLQAERSSVLAVLTLFGFLIVFGLHLFTGLAERIKDDPFSESAETEFVEVCSVEEIQDDRARIFTLGGERVAVFKYDGKISAISNVCQHQNGPLGEGKVVDGCVTCPWHGYQYRPNDGASPPPFSEKVPTFEVKLEGDRIFVKPKPHPAGTPIEPAIIDQS
jgi:nitrite reductase/ring-hydroxylating ferredoxin subunit/DMSO/TMAO reductase YedYZ heme-binding membrane subunit